VKNFRVIAPVLVCLKFSFYVIGCGSPTSGGGSSSGSGRSGTLSDPYIEGATVFVDANNNGICDAGEMIATTDANGRFTFTQVPSLGATIRILVQGKHLGVTYDANLTCSVDGTGILNMTPITTMLANGISTESVVYILSRYAAITMDAGDLRDDPMSGLVLSNTSSIAKIRGAICAYALIQLISSEGGVNGHFDVASIEGSAAIRDGLSHLGDAVRGALSDSLLTTINTNLQSAEVSTRNHLPGISPAVWNVNFPTATADDIANSAFAITRYVVAKAIAAGSGAHYDPTGSLVDLGNLAQNVGVRYYSLRNLNKIALSTTPSGSWFNPMTWYDLMGSGEVLDANHNPITTFEVNSTTDAFSVNDDGSIEVVWK
jgi:hypothetical protein